MNQAATAGSARILAVCTANICRSPAVERLLRAGLDDSVQVGSAGMMALVGEPIDPPVAGYLAEAGASVDGFAARQVTAALLHEADLVLTLTKAHRAHVLQLAPAVVRRAYTLLEFTRVLQSLDPAGLPTRGSAAERLSAIVPLATAGRALAGRKFGSGDDVPDPFRRGSEAYAHSLDLIHQATETIAGVLRG